MKLKKILLFLIGSLAIFIPKVFAADYSDSFIEVSQYVPNTYISKKHGSTVKYQQLSVIARKSNKQFVYCIEPLIKIKEGLIVPGQDYDQELVANLSESDWNRINLLAYYGYKYGNHTDLKWYAVTQLLIWQTVEPDWDIYFTDKLNGKKIDKYLDEINELNNLVATHSLRPSFNNNLETIYLNNSVELEDSKSVLSNYKIADSSNVNAYITDNKLHISATAIGDGSITLVKKDTNHSHPTIVFYSPKSQNVIETGSYDPITYTIKFKIVGGKVSIKKVDVDTGESIARGDASLTGAVYGIYTENGTKLSTLTTSEGSYITSDILPGIGHYYIQEEFASNGYQLDSTKYYFDITEDNLNPKVTVKEKVIEKTLKIYKTLDTGETEILTPEPNVTFEIYLKSNSKKVASITTDSNGYASVKLPYGVYVVKQTNTTDNYAKVNDFEIIINDDIKDDDIIKHLVDEILRAKLKVIKIDKDTKEIIKRANIKFKIFDVAKNKYVCQTTDKVVCEFMTDANGIMVTPLPLIAGTYKLEEVNEEINGYLWNKQSVEFTIDSNSKLVNDSDLGVLFEVKFENKAVKGNINIKKLGEKAEITTDGYIYNKINLPNIKFGLYADEDIYLSSEKLLYKKGALVKTGTTDSNGDLIFKNLELGKYILKELETDSNHVIDINDYKVELKYKDQYTPTVTYDITLQNYYKKGTLKFTKRDLVTDETIANTKIEIYNENDNLVFSGETDSNGEITINNLKLGKYYIIEKEAASGYVLTKEKVYFEIKDNNEIVKAEMKNKPIAGKLEFTKLDISTSEPLPETLIEIYDNNDNLVFSGRTNNEGKIILDELKYGRYYIIEKEAPTGYNLNSEKMFFEIKEDGEVVKATMVDEKVIVEVPDTEKNDYTIQISAILIGLATGVIFYEESKKRKKKNK